MPYAGEVLRATDFGAGTLYTPTLTASTTDPTLGTGAVRSGAWTRTGNLVTGWARIAFGTGSSVGSGSYRIDLPLPADETYMARSATAGQGDVIGVGIIYDSSAGAQQVIVPILGFASPSRVYLRTYSGSLVQHSVPWTWADGDTIVISYSYLAA